MIHCPRLLVQPETETTLVPSAFMTLTPPLDNVYQPSNTYPVGGVTVGIEVVVESLMPV